MNRQILITGGASGIGRVLVEGFLEAGFFVGVLDCNSEGIDQLCKDFGINLKCWTCDVSDSQQVELTLKSAYNDGFNPEILINNAGFIYNEPLLNLLNPNKRIHSYESWKKVLSINLDSVFLITSNVVENMVSKRAKGVVISISSITSAGNAGQSAYSAAKAGVNALTKTWSKELGPLGIRFASISPGFIDTTSTHASLSLSQIEAIQKQIPLRKLGDPKSVYQAAKFIVDNEYINGAILELDGGLTI